jgi:hypothetical protein
MSFRILSYLFTEVTQLYTYDDIKSVMTDTEQKNRSMTSKENK